MKAEPIIFSGPMILSLLSGQKTQTRRVMEPQPEPWKEFYEEGGCHPSDWSFNVGLHPDKHGRERWGLAMHSNFHEPRIYWCPYGQPGDLLWVRESWRPMSGYSTWDLLIKYAAHGANNLGDRHIEDGDVNFGDWVFPKAAKKGFVSPIFMPRWASRITLEITGVNLIPLQELSPNDIRAEGVQMPTWNPDTGAGEVDPWEVFAATWDHINAKRGYTWESNPFVWRLKFKVHNCNIDDFLFGKGGK